MSSLQRLQSLRILSSKFCIGYSVLIFFLSAREAELEELRRGYDNLKAAHSSLLDTNFQLKQDLDGVRNEIDAISAQNTEVRLFK